MEATPLRRLAPRTRQRLRAAVPGDTVAMVDLAESSGVFTTEELASLVNDLGTCESANGDHLVVYDDDMGVPLGFVQFSPAEITDNTWYVYWIAVAKNTHGQGVGSVLLGYAESTIKAHGGRLLLIETSGQAMYEPTRRFYLGRGYDVAARIQDFYKDGDDKFIFSKRLLP